MFQYRSSGIIGRAGVKRVIESREQIQQQEQKQKQENNQEVEETVFRPPKEKKKKLKFQRE